MALWLQFAKAIEGGKEYRQCEQSSIRVVQNWFAEFRDREKN